MPEANVNILAVLVAAVASMALGFLWYGVLFVKFWMKEMGASVKKLKKEKSIRPMVINSLFTLVMAYVLAHFVDYLGVVDVMGALQAAAWLWLGFVVTTNIAGYLYEGKKLSLYLLYMAYQLVSLALMAIILVLWV